MSAVYLRDWRPGDSKRVALVVDDPDISKWSDLPVLGAERWIAQQQAGLRGPSFAVCDMAGGLVVGKVALRLPGKASRATSCQAITAEDQPAGELSYWVIPDARGRRVARNAVLAIVEIARELGTMRSVVLDIELDNAASLQIATHVGAQPRQPTRIEHDRQGVARTLQVHVLAL